MATDVRLRSYGPAESGQAEADLLFLRDAGVRAELRPSPAYPTAAEALELWAVAADAAAGLQALQEAPAADDGALAWSGPRPLACPRCGSTAVLPRPPYGLVPLLAGLAVAGLGVWSGQEALALAGLGVGGGVGWWLQTRRPPCTCRTCGAAFRHPLP
jgi:hypothetical protein